MQPSTSTGCRPTNSFQKPQTLTAGEMEKLRVLELAKKKISNASLPNIVRRQILHFLKSHHPAPVHVLNFVESWEEKYSNTKVDGFIKRFDSKEFGFLTLYQALKSIPDIVEFVQKDREPAQVGLSKAALERLNDDEDTATSSPTPVLETKLPNLGSLTLTPKSSSMHPPSKSPPPPPSKSPPRMAPGRGLRRPNRATVDSLPLGASTSPPPLRQLGRSLAAKPRFETEEQLFEYLTKKTGITDKNILCAIVTPESCEFYRQEDERKRAAAEKEKVDGLSIPASTQHVFETIMASDTQLRGIPVSIFSEMYKKTVGVDLDPTSLGFNSVMEILKSLPTLFHVCRISSPMFDDMMFDDMMFDDVMFDDDINLVTYFQTGIGEARSCGNQTVSEYSF